MRSTNNSIIIPNRNDRRGPPAVSVIISSFNNARHISAAVSSVQKQTFKNLEVIVVDDRSTDDSFAVLKKIAGRDPRVRVLRTKKNSGGPSVPRNLGVKAARGEFVVFLDGDDAMHPTAIEGMTTIQKATDADIVCGAFVTVPDEFFIPKNAIFSPPPFQFNAYSRLCTFVDNMYLFSLVVVWGKLIRRELLCRHFFRPDIYPYEDVEFLLRLYAKVRWGAVTNNVAVYYRESATSVIQNKNRDVSGDVIKVLESFDEFVKTENKCRAPDAGEYFMFVRKYMLMFLRIYLSKTLRRIRGSAPSRWRGPRRCVRKVGRAIPMGLFRGVEMPLKHRVALCLLKLGFGGPGARMLYVITDYRQ